MVGTGELEPQLRQYATEQSIAEKLIWTGEIPSGQVFRAFDLLVMPSRYEGFSYTILEAIGLGIPVIVTESRTSGLGWCTW